MLFCQKVSVRFGNNFWPKLLSKKDSEEIVIGPSPRLMDKICVFFWPLLGFSEMISTVIWTQLCVQGNDTHDYVGENNSEGWQVAWTFLSRLFCQYSAIGRIQSARMWATTILMMTMETLKESGMQKYLKFSWFFSLKVKCSLLGYIHMEVFTPSSKEIFLQLYQARRVLCSMDTHTRTCTELHAKVKRDLAVAQRSRSAPRTTQALEGLPEETFARQVLVGQNAGRDVRGWLQL